MSIDKDRGVREPKEGTRKSLVASFLGHGQGFAKEDPASEGVYDLLLILECPQLYTEEQDRLKQIIQAEGPDQIEAVLLSWPSYARRDAIEQLSQIAMAAVLRHEDGLVLACMAIAANVRLVFEKVNQREIDALKAPPVSEESED